MRSALPCIEVLYKLRKQRPDVFDKMEGQCRQHYRWAVDAENLTTVYIDGGVRRGTGKCQLYQIFMRGLMMTPCADVLKALCLGATAVGLGRPFLYAQSVSIFLMSVYMRPRVQLWFQAYGEEGVVKTVQILTREIVRGMQLLGASNVKQLVPEMVSTASN